MERFLISGPNLENRLYCLHFFRSTKIFNFLSKTKSKVWKLELQDLGEKAHKVSSYPKLSQESLIFINFAKFHTFMLKNKEDN